MESSIFLYLLEFSHESLRLMNFPGVGGGAEQPSASPDGGRGDHVNWSVNGPCPGEGGCFVAALWRSNASISFPGVGGTSVPTLGLRVFFRCRICAEQPTSRVPLVVEGGKWSAVGEGNKEPEILKDNKEEDGEMGELTGAFLEVP